MSAISKVQLGQVVQSTEPVKYEKPAITGSKVVSTISLCASSCKKSVSAQLTLIAKKIAGFFKSVRDFIIYYATAFAGKNVTVNQRNVTVNQRNELAKAKNTSAKTASLRQDLNDQIKATAEVCKDDKRGYAAVRDVQITPARYERVFEGRVRKGSTAYIDGLSRRVEGKTYQAQIDETPYSQKYFEVLRTNGFGRYFTAHSVNRNAADKVVLSPKLGVNNKPVLNKKGKPVLTALNNATARRKYAGCHVCPVPKTIFQGQRFGKVVQVVTRGCFNPNRYRLGATYINRDNQ